MLREIIEIISYYGTIYLEGSNNRGDEYMNLALGCRERVGDGWVYYLVDHTALNKDEWEELIKKQVEINHDEDLIQSLAQEVKIWNKEDTAYDMAIQLYATRKCTNIEGVYMPKRKNVAAVQNETQNSKKQYKVVQGKEQTGQLSLDI